MSELPVAIWSGEIMGIKVHVLDDGRRIVDADDLARLFEAMTDDFDFADFALKFRSFMNGESPR